MVRRAGAAKDHGGQRGQLHPVSVRTEGYQLFQHTRPTPQVCPLPLLRCAQGYGPMRGLSPGKGQPSAVQWDWGRHRRAEEEEERDGEPWLLSTPDAHIPLSPGLLGSLAALGIQWDPVRESGGIWASCLKPGQRPSEDLAPSRKISAPAAPTRQPPAGPSSLATQRPNPLPPIFQGLPPAPPLLKVASHNSLG